MTENETPFEKLIRTRPIEEIHGHGYTNIVKAEKLECGRVIMTVKFDSPRTRFSQMLRSL